MRNRLWNELTQAKHDIEYVNLYLDRQKSISNWFNISVLVFSTSGILGWKIWDNLPIIACIIVSIISLLKLLQPHIFMDEKSLSKINQVQLFYCKYFNKLEDLWYQFEKEELPETIVRQNFFQIIEAEVEINKILNELSIKKPKRLVKKAKQYSDDYFYRVFNVKN